MGRAGTLAEADRLMAGSEPPRLLMVDISLPDGSGLEWVSRLRSHNREVMVMMVTASCDVGDHTAGPQPGRAGLRHQAAAAVCIQQSLEEILVLHRRL